MSLLPRSVKKIPLRLRLEIEFEWHSKYNRLCTYAHTLAHTRTNEHTHSHSYIHTHADTHAIQITYEWVISNINKYFTNKWCMNESCHVRLSYVHHFTWQFERVISHMNESCHVCMRIAHTSESCHSRRSHVIHGRIMSHMNELWHIFTVHTLRDAKATVVARMRHVTRWPSRVTY